MVNRIKEIMNDEEWNIEQLKKELENLNKSWFKTAKTNDLIDFLKVFIKDKEEMFSRYSVA